MEWQSVTVYISKVHHRDKDGIPLMNIVIVTLYAAEAKDILKLEHNLECLTNEALLLFIKLKCAITPC